MSRTRMNTKAYVMKVMSDDKKYEIFVEIPVKYEKPETS